MTVGRDLHELPELRGLNALPDAIAVLIEVSRVSFHWEDGQLHLEAQWVFLRLSAR